MGEESICVDLDAGQIKRLENEFGLKFDEPELPTSGASGPGPYTVAIHPADEADDCGDCRQRIDVLADEEWHVDGGIAAVKSFVLHIGGQICE